MSDQFVAEIRIFAFYFAPVGWAFCSGQLLPISSNTALFALLGTQYGGDGRSNFALPNLNGAVAIHTTEFAGNSPFGMYAIGDSGGETSVPLLNAEMPSHAHTVQGDVLIVTSNQTSPANHVPGNAGGQNIYSVTTPSAQMNPSMVSLFGGGAAHNNMQPYLSVNYCIALQGIFPPRP